MNADELPILTGDEFKEVWEDHLTGADRRSVSHAVRRGQALDEPGSAAIAVALARRYQRFGPIPMAAYAVMFVFWVWVSVWIVQNVELSWRNWVAFVPFLQALLIPARLLVWFRFQRPRFRAAEVRNLALV